MSTGCPNAAMYRGRRVKTRVLLETRQGVQRRTVSRSFLGFN